MASLTSQSWHVMRLLFVRFPCCCFVGNVSLTFLYVLYVSCHQVRTYQTEIILASYSRDDFIPCQTDREHEHMDTGVNHLCKILSTMDKLRFYRYLWSTSFHRVIQEVYLWSAWSVSCHGGGHSWYNPNCLITLWGWWYLTSHMHMSEHRIHQKRASSKHLGLRSLIAEPIR
jgi:hypothetical protein